MSLEPEVGGDGGLGPEAVRGGWAADFAAKKSGERMRKNAKRGRQAGVAARPRAAISHKQPQKAVKRWDGRDPREECTAGKKCVGQGG